MDSYSKADIDSVLENINRLIEDMDHSFHNNSIIPTVTQPNHKLDQKSHKINDQPLVTQESADSRVKKKQGCSDMQYTIPQIHCEFTNDMPADDTSLSRDISQLSVHENHTQTSSLLSTQSIDFTKPYITPPKRLSQEIQHKENKERVKEAMELVKLLSKSNLQDERTKSKIKNHTARLYNSAGNTPQDSPVNSPRNSFFGNGTANTRLINKTIAQVSRERLTEDIIRRQPVSNKLEPTQDDKYDVSIICPDDQIFKAGVFKSWTAFQLAWKIAHVKGMSEKLALVIQEHVTDLHLYRVMEDHENVHQVISKWAEDSNNTLKLKQDLGKYDLFNEPADYLPFELLDSSNESTKDENTRSRRSSLLRALTTSDLVFNMSGWIYIKDFDKKQWRKQFLRFLDSSIYISNEKNFVESEAEKLYDYESCFIYSCLPQFMQAHGTPNEYCFCLIPSVVTEWSQIKCFCTDSKHLLLGWLSGFRLMKYGEQLYLNFREAMRKEDKLRRANSDRQSIMYRRSSVDSTTNKTTVDNKAAIDFSGSNGRIISDPHEAERIQHEISFEIPKAIIRRSGCFTPTSVKNIMLENKIWFHGKMDREQAIQKIKKHGVKEGLYLVRESNSCQSGLVLTVVTKKNKISHYQILQTTGNSGASLYGIENGPQFTSLDLLIESYNSGLVTGASFTLRKPCP